MLAALALAAAAAPQSAPEEALVLHFAGSRAALVDPLDAPLAEACALLGPRLAELGRDLGIHSREQADLVELAHGALERGFTLRVGRAGSGALAGPWIQLALRADDEDGARDTRDALVRRIGATGVLFEAGADGGAVARTPLGPVVVDLLGPDGDPGVVVALGARTPDALAFGDTGLPADVTPRLALRVDGARLREIAQPFLATSPIERPPVVMLALEGLFAARFTYAEGLREGRSVAVRHDDGLAARMRENDAFPRTALGAADLARVPRDATWVLLREWGDGHAGRALRSLLGAGASERLVELEDDLGVHPIDDVLAHVGPTFGAYGARSTGGGGPLSTVAFVECSDVDRVTASLARAWSRVDPLLREGLGGRVAVRAFDAGGARCATLVFPGIPVPLEPSFAATDGLLLAAATPAALRGALAQLGRDECVAEHPRFPVLADGALGLTFLDAPSFLDRGYGRATLFASALANSLRSPYDARREPPSLLPSLAALARGTTARVAVTRARGDDLVTMSVGDGSVVRNATALLGTPAADLYALVVPLSMTSAVAIPRLLTARIDANESAAIAALRGIAAAQTQFQLLGAIDNDWDKTGEYALLGELSGAAPLRFVHPDGTNGYTDRLEPPYLAPSFAPTETGAPTGFAVRHGYVLQVWLPAGRDGAVTDVDGGGAARESGIDPDLAERHWCAYAWPVDHSTGRRTFYVDEMGDVRAAPPDAPTWSGEPGRRGATTPPWSAARGTDWGASPWPAAR